VIDLKTHQVQIAGIVSSSDGAWMRQIARNWTDSEDGFLLRTRYLIHDRDPLFTRGFREILDGSGVHPVRLPSRSPNLNAYAERFVRSSNRSAWHKSFRSVKRIFDEQSVSTSSTTTASAITRELPTR
jgi:hypothetical protein